MLSAVTIQVLVGVVLVSLGVLLGSSWTVQVQQPKLRRQAEERRRLNAEWFEIRKTRQERDECPRCGILLSAPDSYYATTIGDDRPDDA